MCPRLQECCRLTCDSDNTCGSCMIRVGKIVGYMFAVVCGYFALVGIGSLTLYLVGFACNPSNDNGWCKYSRAIRSDDYGGTVFGMGLVVGFAVAGCLFAVGVICWLISIGCGYICPAIRKNWKTAGANQQKPYAVRIET